MGCCSGTRPKLGAAGSRPSARAASTTAGARGGEGGGGVRAGVARAVRAARRGVVDLEPVHVALGAIGPAEVVPLVDAVDPAARRGADIGVGEQELADGGLEREAVHAMAGGVDEHGARAVHDVTRAQLSVPRLQAVL